MMVIVGEHEHVEHYMSVLKGQNRDFSHTGTTQQQLKVVLIKKKKSSSTKVVDPQIYFTFFSLCSSMLFLYIEIH